MSETILSERTNKCLKVMASPASPVRSLSIVSWRDINFWSLPGLPDQNGQPNRNVLAILMPESK
jgi:hypothetical protein